MKINFIYKPIFIPEAKYLESKKQLIQDIVKARQVNIVATYHTPKSIQTNIVLNNNNFIVKEIPNSCIKLKFLKNHIQNRLGFYYFCNYFKLLKKQSKKEYEFYITEVIKEFISNIEEQINKLDIIIYTNIKELLYDTIQINEVTVDSIIFSDGSELIYKHEQDCCENNYADFGQIDDLALSYSFKTPLKFELCDEGFRFGDGQKWVFVPCYSDQNGYYSNELDIIYNNELIFNIGCTIIT